MWTAAIRLRTLKCVPSYSTWFSIHLAYLKKAFLHQYWSFRFTKVFWNSLRCQMELCNVRDYACITHLSYCLKLIFFFCQLTTITTEEVKKNSLTSTKISGFNVSKYSTSTAHVSDVANMSNSNSFCQRPPQSR